MPKAVEARSRRTGLRAGELLTPLGMNGYTATLEEVIELGLPLLRRNTCAVLEGLVQLSQRGSGATIPAPLLGQLRIEHDVAKFSVEGIERVGACRDRDQ